MTDKKSYDKRVSGSSKLLSDDDVSTLRAKYRLIDIGNDGKITPYLLAQFFHKMGVFKTADIGEASNFLNSVGYRELIFRQFLQVHDKIFEKVPADKLEQLLQQNSAKSPRPLKFVSSASKNSVSSAESPSISPSPSASDVSMSVSAIVSAPKAPEAAPATTLAVPHQPTAPPQENGHDISPRIPSVSQLVGPDPSAPSRESTQPQNPSPSNSPLPPIAPVAVVVVDSDGPVQKPTKRRTSSRTEAAGTTSSSSPSKSSNLPSLDAELEKKRLELAELDASLAARRKEHQALETEILRSKMLIEQLLLEKQQMIAAKSQIQEQIVSSKETLADVVATLEQKMEQLTEISETLMDKQDRLDTLNDRVRQKDQELKQKRDELSSLTHSVAAASSSMQASGSSTAQPSPSAPISRKSSANLPIIADAPASSASTATDVIKSLPSAFSVDTNGRGAIVDAREDTAASSSVMAAPKEAGATFSESEPNRAATFAKLTAALAPKQMETLQQLHGDLSASEDVDDLTKRDEEHRKRRDAEVKKIMTTEIAASPNLRAALNRSTSNPSSTSEVSPRENGSATALDTRASGANATTSGGEEAPMISPREKKDKDKKQKTKKHSRDKDKHKDKEKEKESNRKKMRTPKASAEYIATPSLPTPPQEPDETPAPVPSSHKKVKTPKSSREKMPPLIHSDNTAPSTRPSKTSNDAGSGTNTAEETPPAVPSSSRKSKTPKSSRERMPTTNENGGTSGGSKKKTTSVREFTPFGAHTQPGALPDPGYIKTPTLPPPVDLEDLELSVFNDAASKAAGLCQALQAYQIHLDRLYVNIMTIVSTILSELIKNFSNLRYTPEECDVITKILSDELVTPIEAARKILTDFPALISTSLQLKGQIYAQIAQAHVASRSLVLEIEKRVKIFQILAEDLADLGNDSFVRERLAPLYARDPVLLKWDDFYNYFNMIFSEAHFKILRYLLDPCNIGWILFKRLAMFLAQFGPLKESVHKVKVFLDHPAFQGLLTEAELIAILSSCPHGTYLISLNRTQPKVVFQISWYAPQDDKVHSARIRVDNGLYSIDGDPSSQALFGTTPPAHNVLDGAACSSLAELLDSHAAVLVTPFVSKFTRDCWFFGDVNADEATRLLTNRTEGSFLFRLSSRKGCMAVSYIWQQKVGHTLIKFTNRDLYETMNEPYNGLEHLLQKYVIFHHAMDCRTFSELPTTKPLPLF